MNAKKVVSYFYALCEILRRSVSPPCTHINIDRIVMPAKQKIGIDQEENSTHTFQLFCCGGGATCMGRTSPH